METIKRKTMYWRNPTKWEIKFGEGAIHYIEIDIERVIKPNGTLKNGLSILTDYAIIGELHISIHQKMI